MTSYLSSLRSPSVGVLSLDDFYIPYNLQNQLYIHTKSSLWERRGNPGTHDLPLLVEVLRKISNREKVQIPQFDKSLHQGRGDRIEEMRVMDCAVLNVVMVVMVVILNLLGNGLPVLDV